MKTENIIKIVLSALFLICLLDMPYGYYQLVRFLGMSGFIILAYISYKEKTEIMLITYLLLAILFQPIFKISLGRTIWNIVDVILAVFLLVTLFYKKTSKNETKH